MEAARLSRFRGPNQIVEAVQSVLDPAIDLVLVQRLLRPRAVRAMLHDPDRAGEILADAVPRLTEADAYVSAWWAEHGYADYRVVGGGVAGTGIRVGMLREGGVSVHLDEDEFADDPDHPRVIFGPWSMSLALNRQKATFVAERVTETWFTPDGAYDGMGLTELLADEDRHLGRPPFRPMRTSVRQGIGDAALFAGHPCPSFHGTEADARRRALVFESCLVHDSLLTPGKGVEAGTPR